MAKSNQKHDRYELALSSQQLGRLRQRAGQLDEAATFFRSALEVRDKLVAEFDEPRHRADWADSHRALVDVLLGRAQEVERDMQLPPSERQAAAQVYRDRAREVVWQGIATRPDLAAWSKLPFDLGVTELFQRALKLPDVDQLRLSSAMHRAALEGLKSKKAVEAEALFRACLAIREKEQPESWMTFHASAGLGAALLKQQKSAEAEPLLVRGYEGLKRHESKIPAGERHALTDTLAWLVELYGESANPAQAEGAPTPQATQRDIALHFYRASLAARMGKWAEAIRDYTAVLETDPHHFAARKDRAELYLKLGLLPESAADNTEWFRRHEPGSSLEFLKRALLCLAAGDDSGYRDTCRRMVARFADSADGEDNNRLAIVLGTTAEPVVPASRVVEFAERAVRKGRTVFRVAYLGLSYYRAGEFDRAAAALEESLKLDATWFPGVVRSAQAMVHYRAGEGKRAVAALDQAKSALDGHSDAMLAKEVGFWPKPWWDIIDGQLLYCEAHQLIHGAVPAEDARLLTLRGRALRAIHRFDAAEDAFDRAIEQNAALSQAWSGRAYVHFDQGQWKSAIPDFSQAIEIAPNVHANFWHRAHCYLNLAQWEQAATEFEKIEERWPGGGEGRYLRGLALANMNRPEDALLELRRALASGFRDVETMKNDSRLAPLRDREDFRALLCELQRQK